MVVTLKELQEFSKLFNPTSEVYKALVGDESLSEVVVAPGEYATHKDINSGAIANITEYERRMVKFLTDMLRIDLAQGEYLEKIINDYFGIERPLAYTDNTYYLYAKNRVLSQKESAVSLQAMLQPFSSQPVVIYESGDQYQTMFSDCSYANWNPFTHDTVTDLPVTPDIMGGDGADGTLIYYFRVKLQPIDLTSEKLIVALLKISHVAGIRYDIEYYAPFP